MDQFQDSGSRLRVLQVIAFKCLELLIARKVRKCEKCCESMKKRVLKVEKVFLNVGKAQASVLNVENVEESAQSVEKV